MATAWAVPAEILSPRAEARFLPLDAFRGLIMALLVSDGFGLRSLSGSRISQQFDHVPWEGMVFWDMIAPAFVFMVGMSMPYALARRAGFRDRLRHVAVRSPRLLVFSQVLISISSGRLHFQMHNILSHIAVAYLACFFIMQWRFRWQAVAAVALFAVHTALFFLFPGSDGAFTRTGNIAAAMDRALMGYNYASWTANWNMVAVIPSTLFGVWAGNLLRSARPRAQQMKILAVCAAAAFAGGAALGTFIPVIRRIWTASLALYSLGWILLSIVALYLIIEVAGYRRFLFPLTVVGGNAIVIYTLDMVLRGWLDRAVGVFTGRFTLLGAWAPVAQSCAVLAAMWYCCYWLHQRDVHLRL